MTYQDLENMSVEDALMAADELDVTTFEPIHKETHEVNDEE